MRQDSRNALQEYALQEALPLPVHSKIRGLVVVGTIVDLYQQAVLFCKSRPVRMVLGVPVELPRRDALTHEQANALVESWLRYPVQEISVALLRNAMATRSRWQISYWDAAIVEAAREAGCPILLSEDFQHGMDFAGVRVVDPFV